jgi:hypothetical protein
MIKAVITRPEITKAELYNKHDHDHDDDNGDVH